MEEESIHHRILKLRDVSLGMKKAVSVNSSLAPASYDCAVDSLLALYSECKSAGSLAKDKNVVKFLNKYEDTISALKKLRVAADDFVTMNIIGRGHFGEVMLCQEKSTKDIFAMKIMKKAHILQQPDAAFYSAERDIMAWSSSPWLTSLHYAFQDPTSLYLVMDYHPGGDLLNVMERKEGSMSIEEARFYLAEITAGLKDLHELGFVHRDVKPENVLISRSGHIRLVDFGSAARLNANGKVIETQLPVGTPEYISPEVLTSLDGSADYGVCCDWWSLGIIAYELIYETTPFEGDSTSQTYNNIMSYKKSLSFPEEVEGHSEEEARDLIKSLLTDVKARLDCSGIQSHAFFALTDWDNLLNVTPPHIPVLSGPDDVSNFDTFEPLKDDNLKYPDLPSRNPGFSGKSLPFVGFTFSSPVSTPEDFLDSVLHADGSDGVEGSGNLKGEVERAKRKIEEEKAKRLQLEKECVVYQSQLEEFHRKLELEKSDRRLSDTRAHQLLQEVMEKGKLAQQLREEQARTTEVEYGVVVEQLEQERQEASKRSQRLQEKLNELQKEKTSALKKASDYKAKLAEGKESHRKEITALQAKLTKATEEGSSKVEELHERYAEALKKRDQAEAAKKKAEMELQKVQIDIDTNGYNLEDTNRQLTKYKSNCDELQVKLDSQLNANNCLKEHCSSLTETLKRMEDQLDEVQSLNRELEGSKVGLQRQLHNLEEQLKDMKSEQERLCKDLQAKEEEISSLESKVAETAKTGVEHKTDTDKRMKTREKKVENLEKENQELKGNLSSVSLELSNKTKENKKLSDKMAATERSHEKVVTGLHAELQSLQAKLSEAKTQSQQQSSKLKEAKKAQRELEGRKATLQVQLSAAQVESQRISEQLKESGGEVAKLRSLKDSLKLSEVKLKAAQYDNELARKDLTSVQEEVSKLTISRDKAVEHFNNALKQLEAKELNISLLQRSIDSLKEELKEAKTTALDAQKQQVHWKSIKEVIEGDLEVAESKMEEANASVEREKKSRLAAEQRMSQVAQDMEDQVSKHAEELQKVNDMLSKQKDLATKYSMKLMELEKEKRLRVLNLREAQKKLTTEQAVSSKFYDEVQAKSRELNKLKASHMKLLKESQQLSSELAQQQEMLKQHHAATEKHQIQETRLQTTIAQQNKLIDMLRGIMPAPGSQKKKGLKFGRKGRDPSKEIAEWNKLKGSLAGKGSNSQATATPSNSDLPTLPTANETTEDIMDHSDNTQSTQPPVTTVTGTKRTATEVNGPSDSEQQQSSGQPHTFRGISKSGIRSTYTCTACKGPIKGLQKLIKCSYCHVPCHAQCIDSIPNNCKALLPEPKQPPAKKAKKQAPLPPNVETQIPPSTTTTTQTQNPPSGTITPSQPPPSVPPTTISHSLPPASTAQNSLPATTLTRTKTTISSASTHKSGKRPAPPPPEPESAAKKKSKKGEVVLLKVRKTNSDYEGTDGKESQSGESNGVKSKTSKKSSKNDVKLTRVTSLNTGYEERDEPVVSFKEAKSKVSHSIPRTSESDSDSKKTPEKPMAGQNGKTKAIKNIYTGFESSKVIKMEQTSQPRAGMMTEGWLVLTMDTLCLYDRDPRGVTRKPIHKLFLKEPGVAYVVLPSVTRQNLPLSQPSSLVKAFGIQIHSSKHFKELCFVATSVQSKIEWVELIQKALSEEICTSTSGRAGEKEGITGHISSPSRLLSPKGSVRSRELKAVSIVPLLTTPLKGNTPEGGRQSALSTHSVLSTAEETGIDFSIRSSMLNSPSSSDDSSII